MRAEEAQLHHQTHAGATRGRYAGHGKLGTDLGVKRLCIVAAANCTKRGPCSVHPARPTCVGRGVDASQGAVEPHGVGGALPAEHGG